MLERIETDSDLLTRMRRAASLPPDAQPDLPHQHAFLRRLVMSPPGPGAAPMTINVLRSLNQVAQHRSLRAGVGSLRRCDMTIGSASFSLSGSMLARRKLPSRVRVRDMTAEFIEEVNDRWAATDPVALAAFILWGVGYIHPFTDGNGRTARAAAYYALCLKIGGWLPGNPILPEAIRRNRLGYVQGLTVGNEGAKSGSPDLSPLHAYLCELLDQQVAELSAEHRPLIQRNSCASLQRA